MLNKLKNRLIGLLGGYRIVFVYKKGFRVKTNLLITNSLKNRYRLKVDNGEYIILNPDDNSIKFHVDV